MKLNGWEKVFNTIELNKVLTILDKEYQNKCIVPDKGNVFKSFFLCSYNDAKVIMIGLSPYPQENVATGLLFGNKLGTTKLSTSLVTILDSINNPENPEYKAINFDSSLESWANQGVLLLNMSLTTECNKVNSHSLIWKKFIVSFLQNLSMNNPGLIYVLWGEETHELIPFIKNSDILLVLSRPYYGGRKFEVSNQLFEEINKSLYSKNKIKINWK